MKQLFIVIIVIFALHSLMQAADRKPVAESYKKTEQLVEKEFSEPPKKFKNIKTLFGKAAEKIKSALLPGKFPSFLWSFILSAVGAYTIYGLVLGPLSVLVVYLLAKKQKKEVMKSVWGWITGTAVGLGFWILLRVL